jgi:hypothetical protein
MATAKNAESDQTAGEGDGTSPLLESIDPRQAEANNLTSTPDEADVRDQPAPDPKDNPAAPNDVSNVVDPSDPMTLTGTDAQPGENGQ